MSFAHSPNTTTTAEDDEDNSSSTSQPLTAPQPYNALALVPHSPSSTSSSDVEDTDNLFQSSSSNASWLPILSDSHQVVLYNSNSHALSVRKHSPSQPSALVDGSCPYCHRPYSTRTALPDETSQSLGESSTSHFRPPPLGFEQAARAPNYFHLLQIANETNSRPGSAGGISVPPSEAASRLASPRLGSQSHLSSISGSAPSTRPNTRSSETPNAESKKPEIEIPSSAMAEGYFHAFFREEYRLGMGANGSVYLCQHVLDNSPLGYFAVKKIAVGQSHSYLLNILREVKLLERLRHPNIITYHHAWLETHQFSQFGPSVPTLFVLMQWAEGGSLDDFIEARLGRPGSHPPLHSQNSTPQPADNADSNDILSRSERIRAFRLKQQKPPKKGDLIDTEEPYHDERRSDRSRFIRTAVHLLSAEEIKRLFSDIVAGLAFLHDRSILHLDLKPGNVLLTWDEASLIPRAMLSDFGTSRDMIQPGKARSGNTGTLEYAAPESLPSLSTGALEQVDSKADMWSLGMILHMLLFFRLPYQYSSYGSKGALIKDSRGDAKILRLLETEVRTYRGFRETSNYMRTFESRSLPRAYLKLLEALLSISPLSRPACETVLRVIREGGLDPIPISSDSLDLSVGEGILVPRRPSPVLYSEGPGGKSQDQSLQDPNISTSREVGHEDSSTKEVPFDTSHGFSEGESPPYLVLPRPLPPPAPIRPYVTLIDSIWDTLRRRTPLVFIRIFKSFLLIIKILMLFSACTTRAPVYVPLGPNFDRHNASYVSGTRPEALFSCFILGLAVADTWNDDLWLSLLLGIIHIVVLRWHCVKGNCCT